jgi:hypothetical protein
MEDNIVVNGRIIKWKEEEYLHGLTTEGMKESISMIKRKAKEYFIGLMAGSTKVIGKMGSNMV